MSISVNIAKNLRKSFSANIDGTMIKNIMQREDFREDNANLPRTTWGENTKSIAESNRLWKQMIRYWIWRFQRAATAAKFGGAPDALRLPRMRDFCRGNAAQLKRQRGRKI